MQPKPLFPSLPRNVSTTELRQEIRRRMEIADRLGLIRRPKKWPAAQRLDLAALARSRLFWERHAAVFMEGCHYQVKTILISSMAIALKLPAGRLLMETLT